MDHSYKNALGRMIRVRVTPLILMHKQPMSRNNRSNTFQFYRILVEPILYMSNICTFPRENTKHLIHDLKVSERSFKPPSFLLHIR